MTTHTQHARTGPRFGALGHALQQPFIFATGLAALMHSTWSLGTLFAGTQPIAALSMEYVGWLAPALLIAFALDVGQIVTSAELRSGERTLAKYATFVTFAAATYYLQWLYIVHHMPALALGAGVSAYAQHSVIALRDAAIWIIPALLPLSTLLYTFSYASTHTHTHAERNAMHNASTDARSAMHVHTASIDAMHDAHASDADAVHSAAHERKAPANNAGQITNDVRNALHSVGEDALRIRIACPHCNWQRTYTSKRSAQMALTAHLRKHPESNMRVHVNGHVEAVEV